MGEHKHNKTAIAAKNGEIAPKAKPMSQKEIERQLRKKVADTVRKSTGLDTVERELKCYFGF